MVWALDRKGETFSGDLGVAHGLLYFGGAGKDGKGSIYAFDRATGALEWRFATSAPVSSSPVIAGRMVYIGSEDGAYYGLDALTGEEQWRFELGIKVLGGPALGNGVLYLTGGDGALYAMG
jgi:outer membrane protein assembly factor BamB